MIKISEQISNLRKQAGMTQEELAGKLGVTNQAVSKWESAVCCPDISLLPEIARLFGLTVDELLTGQKSDRSAGNEFEDVLKDDEVLRILQFRGRKLLRADLNEEGENAPKIPIAFPTKKERDKLSIEIYGNVTSDGDVSCTDVHGDVECDGDVSCTDVDGDVKAGGDVACTDVGGDVSAGGDIACCDIGGNAKAGGNIACADIGGDAHAGGGIFSA